MTESKEGASPKSPDTKSGIRCKQIIRGRQCTREPEQGNYCHQHHDQTLCARVGRECGVSKGVVDGIVTALIAEMGWEQINAFHRELRRGQVEDDAGGFILRAIGKLMGARGRYDHLEPYKNGLLAMFTEETGQ
ncbi:hypothetical protein P12x_005346 [Tundrisphaera lichenicola]|uniref:hypothetical protein n=1 Tax=Tundrisphaera lichenicola TaxID=2029860 RepID=UPI003EBCCF1C